MWHGPVAAIVRKDLSAVIRNRGVRFPLMVTPVVIMLVMPTLLIVGGDLLASGGTVPLDSVTTFAGVGDQATQERVTGAGLSPQGRWAVFVLEVFMAPLYLLVPLIVATVIAADSFAGERERGTLEALLHTPTTDRQLLSAKFLAAWLPAMAASLGGFAAYSVLANVLAWPGVGRIFFPSVTWLLLAFWVTPGMAALGLGIMVVASSRVHSLQAAHQVGSLVVLPIVLLLIAQITGVFLFEPVLVLIMGGFVWIAALLMLRSGAGTLRREQLATRL
jgi:ABC-2 type transport system permease protein